MNPEEILAESKSIYECARAFREDAAALMKKLEAAYHFSMTPGGPMPVAVFNDKRNNKGRLDSEWSYFFHGAGCCFENLQTGQVVELTYIYRPEFGYLNGFFFYNYMATTARFRAIGGLVREPYECLYSP